jgi:hypothetical protein
MDCPVQCPPLSTTQEADSIKKNCNVTADAGIANGPIFGAKRPIDALFPELEV